MGVRPAKVRKRHSPRAPQAGCRGRSPRRGWLCPCPRTQRKVRNRPDAPTQARDRRRAGCRGRSPRRGYSVSPCYQKRWRVGRWDNGARQARPSADRGLRPRQDHPPHRRADAGVRGPCHPPIAKYELLCYGSPMKSAADPLLFLGACRIHTALEAKHRASPCGRRAEGTTQGARPSKEGWDRSQCRCKAQALWSHPAPLRFRYGAITDPFQILYNSLTASLRLVTPLYWLRAYTRQNPAD